MYTIYIIHTLNTCNFKYIYKYYIHIKWKQFIVPLQIKIFELTNKQEKILNNINNYYFNKF